MDESIAFLIAEDDALVGRVLVRTLAKHGATELVTTLACAQTALATKPFNAVIADVGLPDGSGLDLLSAARERDPDISLLILSGRVDERKLAEAHHLGAPYLLKPVDTDELGLFALRMRARVRKRQERIASLVDVWTAEYSLTPAEAHVLTLAAQGIPRSRLAFERGVAPSTVKKQVQVILTKTGDASLEAAVSRLLRAVVCGE